MKKIAIYGKGGIGKSTISANISALIGSQGKKVLQIGCDPKHDSTLLLTQEPISTVLDLARNNRNLKTEDYLVRGIHGVDCIEIGGPAPGVGCAGRGIISGMEIIERHKLIENGNYDIVIYDILGDVVCGGFFEPLKKKKVDKIFVVTSGEFNSLFAANNLCKGYINCMLNQVGIKFGGVIANLRGGEQELEIITKFCQEISAPLVGAIPRDERIEQSTILGKPIIDMENTSNLSALYMSIYERMETDNINTIPKPLELMELRQLFLR